MPTKISSALEPMFLPDVEANPLPSPYLNLIEQARSAGQESWQIWNLFAFRPEMTIHMGRFTHAVMHDPGPISHEAGWDDAAIYYAITVAALFNFYSRWVSSSGVQAVSDEGHHLHGAKIADRGYVRA